MTADEAENAKCPYCDNPRGHNCHGIMATCGSDRCFRAACRASAALQRPPVWGFTDIDFANGFESQNLRFRPARQRIAT